MALKANLRLGLTVVETLATKDLSTPNDTLILNLADALASGTAIDQADLLFHDERTLAATSEELDLAGGLTSSFGATLTFVKIKGILIRNTSETAGDILAVGGAAANAFANWVGNTSDIVNVGPNGFLLLWNPSLAGYGVTAGTADLLKIDAGANTITYEIMLIGTSA